MEIEMQKAIIHKGTRLVRALTREDVELRSDEEVVEVPATFTMSNGPWKLDEENLMVHPSKVEKDAATIIPKAVLHKATGVVRRLTVDIEHDIADDEEIVQLKRENYFDAINNLPDGYRKVDKNGVISMASEQEIDDSDVDDAKRAEKQKIKINAVKACIADLASGVTDKKLQAYFVALSSLS